MKVRRKCIVKVSRVNVYFMKKFVGGLVGKDGMMYEVGSCFRIYEFFRCKVILVEWERVLVVVNVFVIEGFSCFVVMMFFYVYCGFWLVIYFFFICV